MKIILLMMAISGIARAQPHEITTQNFKLLFGCNLSDLEECEVLTNREWMILFYAPWCVYCRNTKPFIQKFEAEVAMMKMEAQGAGTSMKELEVGEVDCEKEEDICFYFNIRGYPTILYLTADKQAVEYTGQRTVEGLMKFSEQHDPKVHEHCRPGTVNFSYFDLLLEGVSLYWMYILAFGVVLPAFVGYFCAVLMERRERKQYEQKQSKLKPVPQSKNESQTQLQTQSQCSHSQQPQHAQSKKIN